MSNTQNTNEFWYYENSKINFSFQGFSDFLFQKGFRCLFQKEIQFIGHEDYKLIHKTSAVIKKIDAEHIFKCVCQHLEENNVILDAKNKNRVKIFTRKTKLGWLLKLVEFQNDTHPFYSNIYFANGFLKVSANRMEFLPYSDFGYHIWQEEIIPHNFELLEDDTKSSDFEYFIFKVAGKCEEKKQQFMNAIGCLLHAYKNPDFPLAIVWRGDMGSGKTLIMNGISKIRKVLIVDGRNPNLNKKIQGVTENTKITHFEDVSPKFIFEKLFSDLSNPKTPLVAISSNYLVGDGTASSQERQVDIELTPHYNIQYKPENEFGRMFFSDWDSTEWNKFYNFMGRCVVAYFRSFVNGKPNIKPYKNPK